MTIKVEVPAIFARYAADRYTFEAEGGTVGDAIKDVGKKYPDLVKLILKKDGAPLDSISIFVNGENAYPKAEDRPVVDGDQIKVVMLIQGG